MLNTEQVQNFWRTVKDQGLGYVVIGQANKIKALTEEVDKLKQSNQDLRLLICKMNDSRLTDQAYMEVQRIIIENRDIVEANEDDVWNINRRLDKLQQQILEIQGKL